MRPLAACAMALLLGRVGGADAADQLISGRKLKGGNTGIVFTSKDPSILPPVLGSPDDPTIHYDWYFRLFSIDQVGGTIPWSLPPAYWTVGDAGTRFKYRDPSASAATHIAVVKPGMVKVKVGGGIPFGSGQAIGIVFGGGSLRYCALFEPDTWVIAEGSRFIAKDAPAPTECPMTETTTSTSSTTFTTTTNGSSSTSTTICVAISGTFCDLGDGTVYDSATNLQWETKNSAVDGIMEAVNLHDVDNRYSWAGTCFFSPQILCQPNLPAETACKAHTDPAQWGDGCEQCGVNQGPCNVDTTGIGTITTVWDWVSQLNAAGYAGHSDWRLPSQSGCDSCWTGAPTHSCSSCEAHELETILLSPYPCATSPCIDPIFGETLYSWYWSSSSYGTVTNSAWIVSFDVGWVSAANKWDFDCVRAVRDAS